MENMNYTQILSERILALRKEKGLTQEALAGQLGVSFQAVSKWENAQSCPDIALLPLLAEVFGVTVDSLFGREAKAEQTARREEEWGDNPVFATGFDLPWGDDSKLHGVVYWGRHLLSHEEIRKNKFTFDVNLPEYTWLLRYSPLNVHAECVLVVEGDVKGGVTVGCHMRCNNIGGDVTVGSHMSCNDIAGDVTAGSHFKCVNIKGDASAGKVINCQSIGGDAKAKVIKYTG